MPYTKLPQAVHKRYVHLSLADSKFDTPCAIDMLIRGDLYLFILQTRDEVIHSPSLPSALSTHLG